MEIVFWYLVVGLVVMSIYFLQNNSVFITIKITGFIVGVILWPMIIIEWIRKLW